MSRLHADQASTPFRHASLRVLRNFRKTNQEYVKKLLLLQEAVPSKTFLLNC